MSGVTSLQFRQELLAEKFRLTAPLWTQVIVALTRRVPTTNSSIGQLDEPVGNAYGRITIPLGAAYWDQISENEVANAALVYFPEATGSWGEMQGWAALGGNKVIATGTINDPIRVSYGVRPVLGVGAIAFGLFDG